MRIVVDIDGTLTHIKYPGERYAELEPFPHVREWLQRMKREGHTIVVYTSRRMKTHGGNVGRIMAESGGELLAWLERSGIPCDELYLGKPFGDIILDDMAVALDPARPPGDQLASVLPVYVIAAAGEGRRFKEAGFREEKFEIQARGRSLTYWALKSLPLDLAQRIVVLGQAAKRESLERAVRAALADLGLPEAFVGPRLGFVWLDHVTRGQAETALAARAALGDLWAKAPAVIYNVDTYFESSRLKQRLVGLAHSGLSGLMGLFEAEGEHLSFGRVENGRVVESAEKRRISPLASTGLYVFRSMALFEEVVRRHEADVLASNRELYVAPFYNYVIAEHGPVGYDVAETVYPIGTPEELAAFGGAAVDVD
jgi:capsule biosynthesis phosphatase